MIRHAAVRRFLSGGPGVSGGAGRRLVCGAVACAAPFCVFAADWSINARVNQSFTANSNYNLAATSPGPTYLSTSSWSGTLSAETPNVAGSVTSSGRFTTSGGPGPGTEDLTIFESVGSSLTLFGPSSELTFNSSVAFGDTRTTDTFENGDIIIVEADRYVFNYGLSLNQTVNENNTLALSLSGSDVRFSDNTSTGGLVESETRSASATWTHFVNSRFDLNSGISYRRYAPDNSSDLTSNTFELTVGGRYQFTPVYTLSGSAGASVVASRALEAVSGVTDYRRSTVAEPFYNLTLSRDLPGGSVTLGASQNYSESAFGSVQLLSSVSAGWSHALNPEASLSAGAKLTTVTGNSESQQLSFDASYARELAENWTGSLDYAFRLSRANGENRSSNALSLNFSRNFDIEHISP